MKVKPIWLSLVVIVCFLFVHFRYNFAPFESVGLALYAIVRDYGFTFDLIDFPLQFIVIAVFVIVVSILEMNKLAISGIIMLMLLLAFWMNRFRGILDFSLVSMVPFIVSCIVSIIILLRNTKSNTASNVTNTSSK